ncbi:DUF742 domain-containing protein [Amycolatopsis lexingtonensis]|uniref:DUF742 domain-containing protein n=1 Tax=Amycolatopsis lexingtonensis TaxID=218822 RepID=UPI003F6F94B3
MGRAADDASIPNRTGDRTSATGAPARGKRGSSTPADSAPSEATGTRDSGPHRSGRAAGDASIPDHPGDRTEAGGTPARGKRGGTTADSTPGEATGARAAHRELRPGRSADPSPDPRPGRSARPSPDPRPGRPVDPAEDDRTRGRRAASLGNRLEEPAAPRPARERPYVRGSKPPPPQPRHVLPPEVMLFATGRHRTATATGLDPDLAALCRMCQIPTSIAEVSAYLRQSLDATRALAQHGIDRGLVVADVADLGREGRPPLALLQRVHQGLLRL